MPSQPINVLLVEDNPADARLLAESLKDVRSNVFNVTHVPRLGAAIEALARVPVDVVALDLTLPDSAGLETVSRLQAAAPGVAIVVLTGLQDEALALQAVRQGVQDYLVKGESESGLAARSLRYAVERRRVEAALQESEARFRTMADDAPVLIWVNGLDGAVFVNRQYLDFVGAPDLVDVSRYDWTQFVHPDDRDPYVGAYLECFARRRQFEAQVRFRYRDGTYRWMKSTGHPRFTAGGQFLGYVGSTVDIDDMKRAEAALRDSEARLRAIVGTAVDAIITIDERGLIDTANPATEQMFGYGRDELVGRNVSMLMPDPYRSDHDAYLERYVRTGEARIIGIGREVVGLRKDGTTFPLDLSVSECRLADRRMFTGILHDVSNRRRLEREILEASASEQRRVGHELHDGLCQQLTGMAFSAEILARKLEGSAPEALATVRRLAGEIDQAITQTRALARGLNPVEIFADSLGPALEDLAQKVSDSFGVSCRFGQVGNGEAAAADNTAATHLFRIAQEAISNAIRHGGAKTIELKLHADAGSLSLSVADDGSGFTAAERATAPHGKPAGIGLQTMSYRAKMINGILNVRPGRRGVVVTCTVPRGGRSGAR